MKPLEVLFWIVLVTAFSVVSTAVIIVHFVSECAR